MAPLEGFGLDADISLSELRSEDVLDGRLREHQILRVRRRGETLGVLVAADRWRALAQQIERLETRLDAHEAEAVRAIIAQRAPGAVFEAAGDELLGELEERYADGKPAA